MDSVHMTSGTNGDAVGHNSEFSNLAGDSPEDSRPKSLADRSTDGVAAGSALNPSTLSSGECERIARDRVIIPLGGAVTLDTLLHGDLWATVDLCDAALAWSLLV